MVGLHPLHNPGGDGDGLVLLRPAFQQSDLLTFLADGHTCFRDSVLILGYQ